MAGAGAGVLGVILWTWPLAAGADGSDVAQKLADADTVVGGLTGSVGPDGAYGDQENAGSVPFLGADPTQNLSGVFGNLVPGLGGFNGFAPADGDAYTVIDDKLDAVDSALGGSDSDDLVDRAYLCAGGNPCGSGSKVVDVTSIGFRVDITGTKSGTVSFASLGLPSIGFLPDDGQLTVDLKWSVNVGLVADGNGLRFAPAAGPELTLEPKISLVTDNFMLDLGAMRVRATKETSPTFEGKILVDVDANGNFTFGFGPDSGFKARWHLATEDSPLMGISADLDIAWPLSGAGVNESGLTIKVEDVTVDTSDFVGEDLRDAAATIRDVTHPIRTVASPLLEPIPGLSDLSRELGGDDVTMLRLMEYHPDFPPEFREFLDKLILVDDAVAGLAGGDDNGVSLGSFTLVGDDALKPPNQPIDAQVALETINQKCGLCKAAMDKFLDAAGAPGENGMQFRFPVLDDPATLAGLLLGRDVDLFTFDTGRLGPKEHLHIPLASVLIFSVELDGPIEASIHLKGGFDTRGIMDAAANGDVADLLNGLYLQNPGDGPVIKLLSEVELDATAGGIAEIGGGPTLHVNLTVPPSTPGGKLRPALLDDGIGCALLRPDDPAAQADFGVRLTATIDYLLDSHTEVLAEHKFLTKNDLCDTGSQSVPVATIDNGNLLITTATQRGIPADGRPDVVKVFTRYDANGAPTHVVVNVNNNRTAEFPWADVTTVRYSSPGDNRPVIFRAVKTDGKPFGKKVFVETGDGDDDVTVDSDNFGQLLVHGGDDKVIATAGGALVSGGDGDDYVSGGANEDILGGGEGDDTLDGGDGFDILNGGPGDDVLLDSSPDANCLSGAEGNDQLISGAGADYLNGDEASCGVDDPDPEEAGGTVGHDRIITGGGSDLVVAGNGDDEVRLSADKAAYPDDAAWNDAVVVHGNGGDDHITTGNGADTVHGGPGDDTIVADAGPDRDGALRNGGRDTLYGGLGDDEIDGGDSGDTIFGDNGTDECTPPIVGQPVEDDNLGGDDEVFGADGDDHIALEAGDDTAHGNDGDDVICGHAGTDDIEGDDGADQAFGGTGPDTVEGDGDADELFGNDGADTVRGGIGDDHIVGGSSDSTSADSGVLGNGFGDHLYGDDDDDLIAGDNATITSQGVVTLLAEATIGQADLVQGGDGHDSLFGERGDDELHGDDGDDHAEGGAGATTSTATPARTTSSAARPRRPTARARATSPTPATC